MPDEAGAAIIATTSETGIIVSAMLLDHSATQGAINAFTKALCQKLDERGIRANAESHGSVGARLAPGDDMTPPTAAMGRPAYVFLTSCVTGTVLQVMGGGTTGG